MADLKKTGEEMLLEWKVMVFYQKMSKVEYEIRRESLNEFCRRLDIKQIKPVGWVELRKILRAKDPNLKIPEEIQKAVYRGKR